MREGDGGGLNKACDIPAASSSSLLLSAVPESLSFSLNCACSPCETVASCLCIREIELRRCVCREGLVVVGNDDGDGGGKRERERERNDSEW